MSNFSAVGLRWQAVFDCQIVWNRSTRRAELPSQSPLYRFIRDLNRIKKRFGEIPEAD